jgi:hypothetical protein
MSETQSYKTVTVTLDETFALQTAIQREMTELRRFIASSQGYFDSLAGATDELHVGYRVSTGGYLDSLRASLSALESFWCKLMGMKP